MAPAGFESASGFSEFWCCRGVIETFGEVCLWFMTRCSIFKKLFDFTELAVDEW